MKQKASISLDLDNLWAYMRAHGLPGWREFPTYLPKVVPKIIEIAHILNIELTVFIVGQDAAIHENIKYLRALVQAGHNIGNHSFMHEPWMHRYSNSELIEDIDKAHSAIQRATGIQPIAFRGPGFSVSKELVTELCRRGYQYDASVFPTFVGPLARAAYFRTADLTPAERDERRKQFGRFRDGFKPIRPFVWQCDDGEILEIPVTTIPLFRVPMHLTYIHFLAQLSPITAKAYFKLALIMCQIFRVSPSLLLHPLDFLAADELPELACFPGMGRNSDAKRGLTMWCLKRFTESFDVESLDNFVAHISHSPECNARRFKKIAIS